MKVVGDNIAFSCAASAYLTKPRASKCGIWFKSIASRGLVGWATGICPDRILLCSILRQNGLGWRKGEENTGVIAVRPIELSVTRLDRPASGLCMERTLPLPILIFGYNSDIAIIDMNRSVPVLSCFQLALRFFNTRIYGATEFSTFSLIMI
jgi:hypothetical protein